MKAAFLVMLVLLIVCVVLAFLKDPQLLKVGVLNGGKQMLFMLPVLLIALMLASFIELLLPKGFVEQWLSGSSGWKGLSIAWAAGIITPGGFAVGYPLIAVLQQAQVGTAVLVTYASSLSTLSLMRVPLEIGFYGWKLTALRVGTSLVVPFVAGGLAWIITQFWKP